MAKSNNNSAAKNGGKTGAKGGVSGSKGPGGYPSTTFSIS